jgi:hypothetical protein
MTGRFEFPNFAQALENMGAELISERLEYIEIGEGMVKFDAEGLLKGVEIPPHKIRDLETRSPDELFCYEENQVILYIDRPYQSREDLEDDPLKNSPKYHFKRCQTLLDMDNKGKYESRYIMTNNTSGILNLIPYGIEDQQYQTWVPVCRHCLRAVDYMNYFSLDSRADKDNFVLNFDLRKFFEHYGPYFERHDYERLDRTGVSAGENENDDQLE